MAAHNIDSLSTYKLEVSHPILGAALNIPDIHIPQGSANIFQCFIGSAYNKVANEAELGIFLNWEFLYPGVP